MEFVQVAKLRGFARRRGFSVFAANPLRRLRRHLSRRERLNGTCQKKKFPKALPLGELPPQRMRGRKPNAKIDDPRPSPTACGCHLSRRRRSPAAMSAPGNARKNARGRNHVQLPMISYRWLTSGGFARRQVFSVLPRSVLGFLRDESLKRRPRRPLRSIPSPQAKPNTKEKIPTFFYRAHAKACPAHRSNPQDLGAGGQEFRGAELKKADSCCPYPLRQPYGCHLSRRRRSPVAMSASGNARKNARGRNHVQLPMISYIWLAGGGFARRRVFSV